MEITEKPSTIDFDMMQENIVRAKKLSLLAWSIEIVLVTVGLGVAFAQASTMPPGTSWIQAFPVFGVFLSLAAVELAKIPAATVAFHGRRWTRAFALAGLLVASIISFETIFNGFERFVHATTAPVVNARRDLAEIQNKINTATGVTLAGETTGDPIAQDDAKHAQILSGTVARATQLLTDANSNLDGPETKALRDQVKTVQGQREAAGKAAAESWQNEQKSIMDRLASDKITERLRNQLSNRMFDMPAEQDAVATATAKYDVQVHDLNEKIKASIGSPSDESKRAVEKAQTDLNLAVRAQQDFDVARNTRAIQHNDDLVRAVSEKSELDAKAVTAQKKVAELADNAQMYRWASFVFGLDVQDVPDNKAKQIGAVFGFLLALVGALTGSSVAMYSEWFRVRGVAPRIEVKNVPVEVIVEREVEKRVEVEVPIVKYSYVPIPIGENVDDAVASILSALPEEAASQLREQLSHLNKKLEPVGGTTYARAS